MEKDIGKPVIRFVIPYPWKSVVRGIDAIGIGTIFLVTFLAYFLGLHFELCVIPGYLALIASYLLVRYVTVKYDKIKSPIEITITDTHMRYKKGDVVYDNSFASIKSINVTLDDKQLEMKCHMEEPDKDGATWWRFAFRRKDELGEVDYREFAEKRFIPSAKYMIKRIKELNPDVEITWEDRRKKYR